MLPVGVIGLGDIARKAYLPVVTALPGLDPHLMTRDRAKLDRIGDAHRVAHRHTTLDGLLDAGIKAAFVHAPTERHAEIVTRLLEADVDVFVDKPLSYSITESRALVELARARGRSLMVGFNRRFAPAYLDALSVPRDLVVLQKDRHGGTGDVRTVVLDDFIHLVDTLRLFAPDDAEADVHGSVVDGVLRHVVLRLAAPGFTGLAIMNRASGSGGEVLQVAGGNHRRDVHDLTVVVDHDGAPTTRRGDDWTPVAQRRGMAGMCRHFLDAVRSGTRLDAGDALATHELCERVVTGL
ncbi:Gfo/Idh/MocA family oxidoreductase [Saccharothrix sp. NPDC042600]|uniref:Gfo/Idh/MocA family protein n=1 Tax=Saccharothrix TaxID=2071 RepID=UPI003406F21C|nr:Gfo/Idh/MocA family oxidoreductase [Saccharothrix mutabilis subsp. capreolus]